MSRARTSPRPGDVARRAARVLLRDADGPCLLVRVCDPTDPGQGTWWELPGGGLEPVDGDDTARAAARELAEETGWSGVAVAPPLATRRVRYRFRGRTVTQHETLHPAVVTATSRRDAPRPDVGEDGALLEVAWLSPAELADGRRVEPPDLPALVADLDAYGDAVPRRLRDVDVVGWSDADPRARPLAVDGPRRDGDDVVRDAGPWSATLQAWLAHLEACDVVGVPRPRGIDDAGREGVTWVPGDVAGSGAWPAALRTDDGLHAVGRLLAEVADAAATFTPPSGATWRTGPVPLAPGRVIAHGDVGATNLAVDRDGGVGLLDWEYAHPAHPLRDVGEAAAMLVPLVAFDHARRGFDREPDRRARLAALARGRGVSVDAVLDAAAHAVAIERARVRHLAERGVTPYPALALGGVADTLARVTAFLADHASTLR